MNFCNKKFLLKFVTNKKITKIANKLLATILMINGSIGVSDTKSLMVVSVDGIIKINNTRFVDFHCKDTEGELYSVLLPDDLVLATVKISNGSVIKELDCTSNEIYAKELNRDRE